MTSQRTSAPRRRKAARPGRLKRFLSVLGPGLVTGASDDDPSGIATYSQAGAQFGYGLLWTTLFSLPLMTSIQELSARIGRTTGHGIAGNIRRHYGRWLLYPVVFLLVLANTINIGADLGAMGDALALVIGGPALVYAILLAGGSLLLEVFVHYERYAAFLKWLTLALLSYVATVFLVHVPWGEALTATVWPRFSFHRDYWAMFVALLGCTTISPYLFFWQASQETEEINHHAAEHAVKSSPRQARAQFERIRLDTYIGMALSNVVAFFIMLAAAVTLHAHGVTKIDTSAQAAEGVAGPDRRPADVFLRSLRWGLWGRGFWRCRCWRGRRRMRWGRRLGGRAGWIENRWMPRRFTARFPRGHDFGAGD